MYLPLRAQADPQKATHALAAAAARSGARIRTQQAVTALQQRGDDTYLVETPHDTFVASTLVLAAGAWCAEVGAWLGLCIPIVPVRGQMWSTAQLGPRVFHTISSAESTLDWHQEPGNDQATPPYLTHRGSTRRTRHLYGRQTRAGEIIFGGDRQAVGYTTVPDPQGIEVNHDHAAEVLPLLHTLCIARTWAGLMPFSLDGAPLIGHLPQRRNLYMVSGLASSGFGRGPMAGKLLVDYIHTGRRHPVLAEADPARCVTVAECAFEEERFMGVGSTITVQRIDDYRWRLPRQGQMRVDGLVFASEAMMQTIRADQSLQQVANVAHLPGIVGYSIAMPDIHWGYGFPIGGVAAFDADEGVISPGGIGYDINCGVRLLGSGLSRADLEGHTRDLVEGLFHHIPSGVGSHRRDVKLSQHELRRVLERGAGWAVAQGYGTARDLEHIEENGCLQGAQPEAVSARALERGRPQLGSIGSGNHFVEVDYVAEIYDPEVAQALGLALDQITITIHTGSRGFGYQVCDDALQVMQKATAKYGIAIPDRQLCCAPLTSPEAQEYIGAMYSAANFAFANRQLITHLVRETFEDVLQRAPRDVRIEVIYDVCHNIGKFETHMVDGQARRLCVHRKGATRALPPGHTQIPEVYRHLGQPVLVPGDMGRYSYVLIGTQQGSAETFASSCHGAGRILSRTQAKKVARGRAIVRELEDQGIYVRSAGRATLMEEIPEAYKDVREVVDVVHGAGISKKVVQLRPLGVIKG